MFRLLVLIFFITGLISAEEQERSWKNNKGNELKGRLLDFVERFDEKKKENIASASGTQATMSPEVWPAPSCIRRTSRLPR